MTEKKKKRKKDSSWKNDGVSEGFGFIIATFRIIGNLCVGRRLSELCPMYNDAAQQTRKLKRFMEQTELVNVIFRRRNETALAHVEWYKIFENEIV